jgi:probable HAF family extracellular repeat protein
MHTHRFLRALLNLVTAFVGLIAFVNGQAQVTFTPLGIDTGRWADVSDNGLVVAGLGYGGLGNFRWTQATGTVYIDDQLPVYISSRIAISGDGTTLTGANGFTHRVIRYTSAGGVADLGAITGESWYATTGISFDGQTIVGSASDPTSRAYPDAEAFRWTQTGGMVGLGTFGSSSAANAVSSDGSVVVGSSVDSTGKTLAFRWTQAGGMAALGDLGVGNVASGENPDGSLVVGYFQRPTVGGIFGGLEAFSWTESTGMVGLGQLKPNQSTVALDASADGSIIIGAGGDHGGFIWTPESGMRDILSVFNNDYGLASQTTNWDWLEPLAVTPDGRYIVGLGAQGSWLLDRGPTPPSIGEPPILSAVPEPSIYGAMASFLLLGLAGWRHKKLKKLVG